MNKVVLSVLSAAAGTVVGAKMVGKKVADENSKIQKMSDKHLALFLMMNQWVRVKQEGKQIASYFEKNDYRRIAVYGMSYVGETLVEELKGTNVEIAYGIDKKAESIYAEFDIFSNADALEEVDVVVVTAIAFFDEIEDELRKRLNCPILSLEEILYAL